MGAMSGSMKLLASPSDVLKGLKNSLRPFRRDGDLDSVNVWFDASDDKAARFELIWEDLETARANTEKVLDALKKLEAAQLMRLEGEFQLMTQTPKAVR